MDFKIRTAIPYYLTSVIDLKKFNHFLLLPFVGIRLLMGNKPQLVALKQGMKFWIGHPMDIWAIKEVILDDDYRQKQYYSELRTQNSELRTQNSELRTQNCRVLDIGAGIGDFSILTSKQAKKVFAFEVDEYRYGLLIRNIELNNASNIKAFCLKVKSLDQLFTKTTIRNCDFLKIDCEGNEYEIFENSSDEIIVGISSMAMEVHYFEADHRERYQKLVNRLERLGFQCEMVPNAVHSTIAFLFATLG